MAPDKNSPTRDKDTLVNEISKQLLEQGLEGLRPVMERLLNEVMQSERSEALGAQPYERSEQRQGYANGFKDESVQTRMGTLELRVPQVRGMSFYPQSLEKGYRSERALKTALAEMYVQGVSPRKVRQVTEELCGAQISSAEVSRVAKGLDEELEPFRQRPLGEMPYVFLEARYEKVREGGLVEDLAVLWAIGVNSQGKREVLGVSVSLSEAEVHWRQFLENLKNRGLKGVELIVSDDHAGLAQARKAVFGGIPWQRCQVPMMRHAMAYATRRVSAKEITQAMKDIFEAPTRAEALEKRERVVEKYRPEAPRFVQWLEEHLEEGLTVYAFPREHWHKIRSTNGIERINRELKRRSRVAGLFPHKDSCLRLISALLKELHEEWMTGKRYLDMSLLQGMKQQEKAKSSNREEKNRNDGQKIYRNEVA